MSVRQSKIGVLLIALGSIIAVATLGVRTNQVFAAAQFYGLSFEDVDTTGTSAEYTGGSCPTSTLSNIATMPPVSRANTTDDTGSSDLGFTTVLSNCATGLSNDSVGVIDSGNVLGLSPSPWDSAEVSPHNTSNKIFGTEDIDGRITVTVQSVSCGAGASITASGSYYGRATGWETDDFLRIWVDIDGTEFDLINASTENGASSNLDVLMDTDGMEDGWRDVTTGPHTGNVATLNFFIETENGSEDLAIDDLQIDCGAPTAVTLHNAIADSTSSMTWLVLAAVLIAQGTIFVLRDRRQTA